MTKRHELLAVVPLVLAAVAWSAPAQAAQPKKKKKPPTTQPASQPAVAPLPQEPQEPVIEIEPGAPAPASQPAAAVAPEAAETPTAADQAVKSGQKEVSWQDVVVVVRKPFLKSGRFEFMPSWQVTLNDNMIRHHSPTGQINYWLTEALAIGVEGQYYTHFDNFLEPHDLVQQDYRRLPTLNEYVFGAALDFHYVPLYAKFAMLNKFVVNWEGMFTVGVGVIQTRVLPRDPANPGWDQINITPNVGFQLRVFLTRWLMLDLGVKDYIFVDKFENVNRMTPDVEDAKANATSQLINNIMFGVGLSFWLPTSFEYTTFR
jgi:outer membrane beta-barrel protein